jgi:thiamine-monophosphate kinase
MFTDKDDKKTELSTLGEFGLIRRLSSSIGIRNPETLKGIGDDAAIIDSGDKATVVSTDMLAEGVHFDLSYVPLKHLGYKAAMVNLSDIYAMNATPKQLLVSIAVSNRFPLEAIEEMYEGLRAACEMHNTDIVGGDTTSSRSGLILSITAIGTCDKNDIVYRSAAGENDLICVSGDLGGAFTGLQILEREKRIFMENPNIQPDLGTHTYILQRQLRPEARKDIIDKLREIGVKPTSMIDVSDGLASELHHICTSSGKGCRIYESKIPIDQSTYQVALDLNLDPTVCAMNGGEDYELLFTIRTSDFEKVQSAIDISVIGHITSKEEGLVMIDKSDHVVPIVAQGWDALRN